MITEDDEGEQAAKTSPRPQSKSPRPGASPRADPTQQDVRRQQSELTQMTLVTEGTEMAGKSEVWENGPPRYYLQEEDRRSDLEGRTHSDDIGGEVVQGEGSPGSPSGFGSFGGGGFGSFCEEDLMLFDMMNPFDLETNTGRGLASPISPLMLPPEGPQIKVSSPTRRVNFEEEGDAGVAARQSSMTQSLSMGSPYVGNRQSGVSFQDMSLAESEFWQDTTAPSAKTRSSRLRLSQCSERDRIAKEELEWTDEEEEGASTSDGRSSQLRVSRGPSQGQEKKSPRRSELSLQSPKGRSPRGQTSSEAKSRLAEVEEGGGEG